MADKSTEPDTEIIRALETNLNKTVEDEEPYEARVSRTDL